MTNISLRFPYGDVTALYEDRAGRFWVGTMGGAFVFQEEQIRLAEVPMALTNQPVSAIYEDRNGVLLFGAEGGLFSSQNGELRLYTERDGVAKYL